MKLNLSQHLAGLRPAGGSPVVAFFDLDRTLIDGYSLSALAWQQFFNGRIGPRRFWQLGLMFISYARKRIGYAEMLQATVDDITGMDEEELRALGRQAFDNRLSKSIYREGFTLIDAHRQAGHDVVMVTSATNYQAEPVAQVLGIEHLCCTEIGIAAGQVTGQVQACHGPGKVTAAERYLEGVGASLEHAYFYSDSYDDLPLLERVGNPVVVNGRAAIVELSEKRGWPVLEFKEKGVEQIHD